MAGPVRIGGVAAGSVSGAAEFQAFLRGYPQQVIDDTSKAINAGADEMVEAIKAVAPVSELEGHPGELRDSVHKEAGRHDLSVVVVEDAGEAEGRGYARFVEFGHKGRGGGFVPPHPHFWPEVRALKRKVAAGIRKAMRDAARGRS